MKRVLVTGATGFVGRRLCSRLVDRGDEVVAAVRESSRTGQIPPQVQCLQVGEIGPETRWHSGILRSVDCIVHLAARVHRLHDPAANPAAEFRRVNVEGTRRLARAAAGKAKRLVYVSSLHAMCRFADDLLTEESPCRPESDYGKSKLGAEHAVREIGVESGMQTVIVRPPPVYGPGQPGNLQMLFSAVQRGLPLPLGRVVFNRRSLIYVENLADALLSCIDHPRAAGQTLLLSDGETVSIADLIRRVAVACGRRSRLWPVPAGLLKLGGKLTGKSATIARLLGSLAVDDSHIRNTLGWTPPFSTDEGLSATARSLQAAERKAA